MTKKGKWTEQEKTFLKENHLKLTRVELSNQLGRSKGAISAMCLKMGLNKTKELRKKREAYIRKYYTVKTTEEIAEHLKIRETSVRKIASQIKVTKRRDIFKESMIYALYKGDELVTDGNVYEIAEFLNMDVDNVKFYHTPSNKSRNIGGKRRELVFLYDEEEEE